MYDFSFVIPAHNEQDNIGRLIDAILALAKKENWKNYQIVVVNDNSSDNTRFVVENLQKNNSNIKLINRSKGKNGMGYALIYGTKQADSQKIIWTMGDLSDDIYTYPKILEKLNQGYDLVFGSRYMKGGNPGNLNKFKAFCSSSFTKTTKLLYKIEVNDITNAFRGFKKEVFTKCDLQNGDFAISPEFAIKAKKLGFKLGEVPTSYTDREFGQASFKLLKMGKKYAKVLINLRSWKS